jgi:pimeloyl-ACP methyl ester carboxylesterase
MGIPGRALLGSLSSIVLALACTGTPAARDPLDFRDETVLSSDGVPIHFRAGGRGGDALVFVHGWLGDAGWWTPQMQRFAPDHRVVALDLAGHGSSGKARDEWTVERFADDVAAVVRALDLERSVLVGHSMSGRIVVQAARVLGARVALVVPVDSLNDAEWDLPPEVWEQFFGGLRADFPGAVEGSFRGMLFLPSSPPDVVERVVAQARAADPASAVPMLERGRDFDLLAALRALRVPIHAINSDANPTRLETNRKYAARFEVEVLPGIGHWPMLEDPGVFGDALERVVATLRP